LPDALVLPLKVLKALPDAVCKLLGVVPGVVEGINGEPNADTAFAAVLMELIWPNAEPGVAGTDILGGM
jgi:hypothetical protein